MFVSTSKMQNIPDSIYSKTMVLCRFHERAGLRDSHPKLLARLGYSKHGYLEKAT